MLSDKTPQLNLVHSINPHTDFVIKNNGPELDYSGLFSTCIYIVHLQSVLTFSFL